MLREVGSLCLAPIALAGYLYASEVTTNVSKRTEHTTGQGAVATVLTCDRGLGLGVKGATNGLYAVEAHYGLKGELGSFSASLLPKAGLSYTDHTVKELPQTLQFSVGAQLLLGFEHYRAGVELWHLSNAGMTQPNIGLNMVVIQAGWEF